MKKLIGCAVSILMVIPVLHSQTDSSRTGQVMTPELLWKLGRVTGLGISKDKQWAIFSVSKPDIEANKSKSQIFAIPVTGGTAIRVLNLDSIMSNNRISPDGKSILSAKDVKLKNVYGKDLYPELSKSNVQVYDELNYRHWDTWEDGAFSHVFVSPNLNGSPGEGKDIMPGELFDCPQKPFGGDEDFIWSPDSKKIIYVTKKKYGTAYTISTNTDLFEYDLESGQTRNLTEQLPGYDINPSFNQKGELAWLSMKREGYEADKQDILVSNGTSVQNLTGSRDDIHVESYSWSEDGETLFFIAAVNGTLQLFRVNYPGLTKMMPVVEQISKGAFDISALVGQVGNQVIVNRADINHAGEIYSFDISTNVMKKLSYVNDSIYATIGMSKTERRFVKTTDGKNMLVWLIYPPDFDSTKKYPVLLFCQGGPQVPLSQFYSFRWNFQLMAANGYIVVAPGRRGMPGFGTKWNEQISTDWGGQVLRDYLSATDYIAKQKFVDNKRIACVGASFGGFACYALAGIHNGRYKTFIAHDGVFDFRSMYGTTDELWFETWEKGGAYWDKKNAVAQRSYTQSPSNLAEKWNTPMLIFHGGRDYRVPASQGFQAFQALQLRGIKSRLVYLPDENHWVLSAQNAQVWQHEFFKWLKETL